MYLSLDTLIIIRGLGLLQPNCLGLLHLFLYQTRQLWHLNLKITHLMGWKEQLNTLLRLKTFKSESLKAPNKKAVHFTDSFF